MSDAQETFGQMPDGTEVRRLTLRGGGLVAKVLTLGAIVQDLRLDGVPHPLVLGAGTPAAYLGPLEYFGAIVGRFANRIAGGRFVMDGVLHQVPPNFRGRHALHGGTIGSGARVWRIEAQHPDSVLLALSMADGEMGFPGNLEVTVRISLPGNGALQFDIEATTDRATPCGFAHHGYFTLDDTGDLSRHRLQVPAAHYLPIDDDLIPTGEIAPVAGTPFDFLEPRSLHRQEIDHNFCLARQRLPLRPVAFLESHASGLGMRVESTEPGLQVYTAIHLPPGGEPGLDGQRYGPFAGVALEAQNWPDAPNRPDFPPAILQSGEPYRQVTRYTFAPVGSLRKAPPET
ncbi:MAG: aldose epimerase family protein [Pararhodobacter sp.]